MELENLSNGVTLANLMTSETTKDTRYTSVLEEKTLHIK